MSANTTIEWATKSWNPVRGCSRVSPGCDECYAMKFAHRFSGAGKPYEGLTTIRKGKVDWSGVARFIAGELDAPLRWKKHARIFVNSMSDLFHHSLKFEEIAAVFGVMAACPQHTFQVLTKRPERALEFFAWLAKEAATIPALVGEQPGPGDHLETAAVFMMANHQMGYRFSTLDTKTVRHFIETTKRPWPLPNVWFGFSAENQELFEERWEHARQVPAAVRFCSYEPAIGPLRIPGTITANDLHWLIIGGESGPGARPFDVQWARFAVNACRRRGIAPFVKQLGANVRDRNDAGFMGEDGDAWDIEDLDAVEDDPDGYRQNAQGDPVRIHLKHTKGGDQAEWPEDLRVREFPGVRA